MRCYDAGVTAFLVVDVTMSASCCQCCMVRVVVDVTVVAVAATVVG